MTNKNPIITAFAAVSLAALAPSCSKSEIQNAYSQQDKDIESIVSSLAPEGSEATVDYLDGAVRVTVKHGEGDALGKSGTVSFFYAGHRITGTSLNVENLFATNNKELAETYAWTVSDTTVFKEVTVDLVQGIPGERPEEGHRRGEAAMSATSFSTGSWDSGIIRQGKYRRTQDWPIICG